MDHGEASRADVQAWRARSSAVLTGVGTVLADDPRLDVRLDYGPWVRQPLRVVLDPALRCPARSRVFEGGGALVYAAPDAPPAAVAAAEAGGVRVERVPRSGSGLDLAAILERLAAIEINELLVEGGPRLAGAFLAARLVDELVLYVAPILLGVDAPPLAALPPRTPEQALTRVRTRGCTAHRRGCTTHLRPKKGSSCSPES